MTDAINEIIEQMKKMDFHPTYVIMKRSDANKYNAQMKKFRMVARLKK